MLTKGVMTFRGWLTDQQCDELLFRLVEMLESLKLCMIEDTGLIIACKFEAIATEEFEVCVSWYKW